MNYINLNKTFVCIILLSLFATCNKTKYKADDLLDYTYNPIPRIPIQPEGFPKMHIPKGSELTEAGIELGRFLFYDPILSVDSTMSCSSCHFLEHSFTDNAAFSKGVDQIFGKRSSMSLLNAGYYMKGLFWDGKAKDLESQALIPVEDPIELHSRWPDVEAKLKAHAIYPQKFRAAFGINSRNEITRDLTVKAIAQFERTLISGNAKFDQVMRGEATFTASEKLGREMFFDISPDSPDAECAHCHNEPFFTVNDYFNNGIEKVDNLFEFPDEGRGKFTKVKYDNGKFRAPTLRNIELTAPYMHDGRFNTLEEVIEHYNTGGHYAENISPLLRPLELTNDQKTALLDFLKTLTDSTFVNNKAFANPFH